MQSSRKTFQNEAEVQEWLDFNLRASGANYEREAPLSPHARIDFLVRAHPPWATPQRIGIEVKVKDSATAILRQLYEYAPYVDELILVSTRYQHHVVWDLWNEAGRKPALHFVHLNGSF